MVSKNIYKNMDSIALDIDLLNIIDRTIVELKKAHKKIIKRKWETIKQNKELTEGRTYVTKRPLIKQSA